MSHNHSDNHNDNDIRLSLLQTIVCQIFIDSKVVSFLELLTNYYCWY